MQYAAGDRMFRHHQIIDPMIGDVSMRAGYYGSKTSFWTPA